MTSLYSMAKRIEVGDKIILKAVKSKVQNQTPKTVELVSKQKDEVRVEVKGPQGGKFAFEVDSDENHKVIHLHNDGYEEDRGPVDTARIVWEDE